MVPIFVPTWLHSIVKEKAPKTFTNNACGEVLLVAVLEALRRSAPALSCYDRNRADHWRGLVSGGAGRPTSPHEIAFQPGGFQRWLRHLGAPSRNARAPYRLPPGRRCRSGARAFGEGAGLAPQT